jgi:hypothetical protein
MNAPLMANGRPLLLPFVGRRTRFAAQPTAASYLSPTEMVQQFQRLTEQGCIIGSLGFLLSSSQTVDG